MATDNAQDIISSILSDPEAMSKLQSLGRELGLTGNSSKGSTQDAPPVNTSNQSAQRGFDLSALSSLLSQSSQSQNSNTSTGPLTSALGTTGTNPLSSLLSSGSGVSPEILSAAAKLLPMLSSLNADDETTQLLNALRPFLSGKKLTRLEEAGKMLRIMRLLPMIRNAGLF